MGCSHSKQVAAAPSHNVPQPQEQHAPVDATKPGLQVHAIDPAESAGAKNTEAAKATEAAKNAEAAKNIEAVKTEAATITEAAKAAAQDQLPTLELQPDKDGRPLEISARQQRLIQLQHSGASRVIVKKLHGGFSGSLVLQTTAHDKRGEPKEPAVSKLDAAAALAEEVAKQDAGSAHLGPYAISVLRRPLYLGEAGIESATHDETTHTDGAMVLELAGACWVLPEFFGLASQEVIVPYKQHLLDAFASSAPENVEGVLDDLYAVGGPLQRLALAKPARAEMTATTDGGLIAAALADLGKEVACSLLPPLPKVIVELEANGKLREGLSAARLRAFAPPAGLREAFAGGPSPSKSAAFQHSFVHKCDEEVWNDAACAPLISLAQQLRALCQTSSPALWLSKWRPLQMLQHGDLNAANVLVDVRGSLWLIDFAEYGAHGAFTDAAKLMAVLLFEYLPCDDERGLRRACAVIDALVPADGVRQLWEDPPAVANAESTPTHALALSLAAKVQRAACDLAIACSESADGWVAADVHPISLWLPLLREALRCLRYQDLSAWQQRVAWHASRRLATAVSAALVREPAAPPKKSVSEEAAALRLEPGTLLLVRERGPDAEDARRDGGNPESLYEVEEGDLCRTLGPNEAGEAKASQSLLLDELGHASGAQLPAPGPGPRQAVKAKAAELATTREQRAEQKLKYEMQRRQKMEQPMRDKEGLQFKSNAIASLLRDDQASAVSEMRSTGLIELRCYAKDQPLQVLLNGSWQDATVLASEEDGQHSLSVKGESLSMQLHTFNHAPLELAAAAYEEQRRKHAHSMAPKHASIRDALSGRRLSTSEQCVPIEIAVQENTALHSGLSDVKDVGQLNVWLSKTHARRQHGERPSAAVLLTAPPAAGKTCLVSQLVMHALDEAQPGNLVPCVIKVMDLQRVMRMQEHAALFGRKWNWVDAYLCATLGEASACYRFLRQALLARRALVLIDGMDEGGQGKAQIERHVQWVLLPQGHPMLLTSRPDSLRAEVYEGCARLQLCPLTDRQQREVIDARLGAAGPEANVAADAKALHEYVLSLPPDSDGRRMSDNPLMLNMLISIFESRRQATGGGGMPTQLAEVYQTAVGVMLGRLDRKERGGGGSDDQGELRPLLEAVALRAHAMQQRQVSSELLQQAASQLTSSGESALARVTSLLVEDRMPLLSVLEREPLVVQFSHLSFQEYLAAHAICQLNSGQALGDLGAKLSKPWQWEPWWNNVVRLGAGCGAAFGRGLLRAAELEERAEVNLKRELEDSAAAVGAVAEMVKASGSLAELSLYDNNIGNEGAKALAEAVAASGSLATLNIVMNKIGPDGAKAIADAVAASGSLANLDIGYNNIGVEGAKAIAEAVRASGSLATLDIGGNKIGKDGAKAIADAVAASGSLTRLKLWSNQIGDEGAKALADGVAASGSLAELSLRWNQIGDEGAKALAAGVAASGSLAELRLGNNEIGDVGAKAIADAVAASGSLAELWLGSNKIGDAGAKAIADAVAASGSLATLHLDGNNIGDEGAKALVSTVAASGSLAYLNIGGNQIGYEGAKALAAAVAASGSLALKELVVPNGLKNHSELMAACKSKGVELVKLL